MMFLFLKYIIIAIGKALIGVIIFTYKLIINNL